MRELLARLESTRGLLFGSWCVLCLHCGSHALDRRSWLSFAAWAAMAVLWGRWSWRSFREYRRLLRGDA